jgi:heptosyltransferase-2
MVRAASGSILVIRGGALGDFILTLPAIDALRRAFPESRLEILGYPRIAGLVARRFYAEAVRSIEYGPMAGFFARNGNLDPALSEYFSGFGQVVSYLFDPDGIFEANLRRAGVRNYLAAYRRPEEGGRHAAEVWSEGLAALAIWPEDHVARLHVSDDDRLAAEKSLSLLGGREYWGIHPGSGGARKNWGLERWRDVVLGLRDERGDIGFAVTVGEAEVEHFDRIQAVFTGVPVVWLRDEDLPTIAAVFQGARGFIGNDSGITHLAAAAGVATTVLFGPTDPRVWAPRGEHVRVVQSADGTMEGITVEAVLERVLR